MRAESVEDGFLFRGSCKVAGVGLADAALNLRELFGLERQVRTETESATRTTPS
jgi:hypothetical protein